MEIREKAYRDYLNGMSCAEIAKKYNKALNTVKSWQRRDRWKEKRVQKGCITGRRGAPFGNENGTGHKGKNKPGNTNALVHGLYAKNWLPEETQRIVEAIQEKSPIDMLWENICLKYAAIIRAQSIMYVKDADDVTVRQTMDGEAAAYEYREAYEKQASFLMAQSRAMATLTSMIRQYEELCRGELATEEQRLRIEKLKAEISRERTENSEEKVIIVDDISGEDCAE